MQDIYELGCKTGLLNYIDHETPRVYFIHAHAELEDFEAFCKALVDDCDAEIERLREALRSIVQFDADYKAENDGKWHSGGVPWAVMCIARAALREKE
jgi:hypothetical protein